MKNRFWLTFGLISVFAIAYYAYRSYSDLQLESVFEKELADSLENARSGLDLGTPDILSKFGDAVMDFEENLTVDEREQVNAGFDSAAITSEIGFVGGLFKLRKGDACTKQQFDQLVTKAGIETLAKFKGIAVVYNGCRESARIGEYAKRLHGLMSASGCKSDPCLRAKVYYQYVMNQDASRAAECLEGAKSSLIEEGMSAVDVDSTMHKLALNSPSCIASASPRYLDYLGDAYTLHRGKQILAEMQSKNLVAQDLYDIQDSISPNQVDPESTVTDFWGQKFKLSYQDSKAILTSEGRDIDSSSDDIMIRHD